ncbi:hypothetical protein N7537_007300 [Penicillium hordei]|uniref:Uncharacterized protein n=1 Tax=Penicillium hordei TaxID=40994 RepID=A0AAD6GZ86_9EURO|nr:uncharacterized protein N7537_007300 [Penicillium hordei]KAJ5597216.1 hypothetical protein N7537_007300 [Penicillium hordei]
MAFRTRYPDLPLWVCFSTKSGDTSAASSQSASLIEFAMGPQLQTSTISTVAVRTRPRRPSRIIHAAAGLGYGNTGRGRSWGLATLWLDEY